MSLSIIIPTCGRDTLARTLASIRVGGIEPTDEVLVVGDGPQPKAERICRDFHSEKMPVTYLEGPTHHCYGMAQRNYGIDAASKDTLLFMDDDDEYGFDALREVHKLVASLPKLLVIGKMMHRTVGVIWKEPKIRLANVGTQMFVVPNFKTYLGRWTDKYEGDYEFIRETAKKWPGGEGGVFWWDHILAIHHRCPEEPDRP